MKTIVVQTLIATTIVASFGLALGLCVLGGNDPTPQCVPCSCASEPFSYPQDHVP